MDYSETGVVCDIGSHSFSIGYSGEDVKMIRKKKRV